MRHGEGRTAALVLKDGSVFEGAGFGPSGLYEGEAVFCTGMTGYVESITDPSYHGQFLIFTYPLIGNYGVPAYKMDKYNFPLSFESDSIKVGGIIAHELCEKPSHWSCAKSITEWFEEEDVPAISGIDTRSLTKRLRESGVMPSVLKVCEKSEEFDMDSLVSIAKKAEDPNKKNLAAEVSTEITTIYNEKGKKTVALLDCGVKYSIIRSLVKRDIRVVKVRYDTPIDVIESYNPHGLLISNGPGDPENIGKITKTINEATEMDIPIFGICLGTQLLCLAKGATTYKLKYGHRSQNQPCIEKASKRCYITSQNHGYAVDPTSLENTDLDMWFANANDGSCEGVISRKDNSFAVQFHPEANPGPKDTEFIFDKFTRIMEK
ncbi:MAG: glutamine-hydrolyzing carbamoyl-phosphate synthase small subunit [Candidatus Methanofastidiosia archaeon]